MMRAARSTPLHGALICFLSLGCGDSDGSADGDADDGSTGTSSTTQATSGSSSTSSAATSAGPSSTSSDETSNGSSSTTSEETESGTGPVVTGDAAQIAAGWGHTCAVDGDGAVRCWGFASSGQLGYGNNQTIGDDETPADAGDVDVGGAVTAVATGDTHTCALLEGGGVRCWGSGMAGKLGYASETGIGVTTTPAQVGDVDVGGSSSALALGYRHSCAIIDGVGVRCWGASNLGTVYGDDEVPSAGPAIDLGGPLASIAAGFAYTCGLRSDGAVRCLGLNSGGKLGTGVPGDVTDPTDGIDAAVGGSVAQLAVGLEHMCALLDDGAVRCWGQGSHGQLGYGNPNDTGEDLPSAAGDVDIGGTVVSLWTGPTANHTCALLDTGNIRCWGKNESGQLGYGNTQNVGDNETPASAGDVDVGAGVLQVAAGDRHTCALLDTLEIRCWGSAELGRLGYGDETNIGDDETPASAGDVQVF